MNKNSYILLLILFIGVLILFIRFPFQISTQARIYPLQRWSVLQFSNGNIQTKWVNYLNGQSQNSIAYHFERGDIVKLQFQSLKSTVSAGDSLLYIESFELQRQIQRLREQLAIQRANLQASETGSKPAVVQQAQRQLAFARQELALARQDYDRNLPLYENGVLPEAEFNRIENAFRLAEIQLGIAESELLVAETGRKPEEVALAQARLKAQRTALKVLEAKAARYLLRAPFDGHLSRPDSMDEILVLEDSDTHVLVFPIPLRHTARLGESVQLDIPDLFSSDLTITQCSRVFLLNQEQVCLYRVELPAHDAMMQGRYFKCRIRGAKISLWTYLVHWFDEFEVV